MDYYQEARRIAEQLKCEQSPKDAQALQDAIDAGSTGSEILMALRWHLLRMDSENSSVSPETARRIRELAVAISAALGMHA